MLNVRMKQGVCGVFLDPPYSAEADRSTLYANDSESVAHACADWCLEHGEDPDYRIVLAGFENDGTGSRLVAAGWREVEWFKAGHLKGGMGHLSKNGTHQQHRERLWLSPHCLNGKEEPRRDDQLMMWDND